MKYLSVIFILASLLDASPVGADEEQGTGFQPAICPDLSGWYIVDGNAPDTRECGLNFFFFASWSGDALTNDMGIDGQRQMMLDLPIEIRQQGCHELQVFSQRTRSGMIDHYTLAIGDSERFQWKKSGLYSTRDDLVGSEPFPGVHWISGRWSVVREADGSLVRTDDYRQKGLAWYFFPDWYRQQSTCLLRRTTPEELAERFKFVIE